MALSLLGRFKVMTATLTSYNTMGSTTFDTPRLGVSWHRPPGDPIDRGEALAQTADDRDALGAQMRDLGAVHDARSRVQQVMGFAAALRRGSEEVEIAAGELRSVERLDRHSHRGKRR
jgi:hypothetical protein